MEEAIVVQDLLVHREKWQIVDVRSPGEFHGGHIPGAVNIPLFTDEERARVGTLYTQNSPEVAFREGLLIAGLRMQGLVDEVLPLRSTGDKEILVHCWRGGQRSKAVAWLYNFSGTPCARLDGGYKSYRTALHTHFRDFKFELRILGGCTGAGKTEILNVLSEKGAQVLDLEKLANHKGSAFGSIGEETQPTSEQFENNIFHKCMSFDPERPVWVENESRSIGKAHLPEGLWNAMKKSVLYTIDVDKEIRLKRALRYYSEPVNVDLLKDAFEKIQKRLGGLDYSLALKALDTGDLDTAGSIALKYYDKAYMFQLNSWPLDNIKFFDACNDVEETADRLLQL
jgi:tRNA 2-selenouridine synthase